MLSVTNPEFIKSEHIFIPVKIVSLSEITECYYKKNSSSFSFIHYYTLY